MRNYYSPGMLGKKHSEETKEKIRLQHLGMKYPKEFGSKISKSLAGKTLENSRAWKGGRIIRNGYVCVYLPTHKNSVDGYVREHRLVMEKKLGRYLKKNENIHHINGDRKDNRIENLVLLSNNDHSRIHYYLRDGIRGELKCRK